MKPKIIFCAAVFLAILAVVLLALFSPSYHTNHPQNKTTLSLSLYLQQPPPIGASTVPPAARLDAGAIIFHRALTEGPTNTSRLVGKAQGFIIPIERFAHSAFNIIYISFDTAEYSGSLSIRANHVAAHSDKEELSVVGGTGSFAFARGLAVFVPADRRHQTANVDATHGVKLQLNFPDRSKRKPN